MSSSIQSCPFSSGNASSERVGAAADPTPTTNTHQAASASHRGGTIPTANWFDPAEMARAPYPTYQHLRESAPVTWVPAINRYLVTRFEACHQVEMDQEAFTTDVSKATMVRALGGKPMLRKDDPAHARDRAPVNPVFRPRRLKGTWEEVFRRNAERYIDRLAEAGPRNADLNRDYAAPVASQNLIDMLGLQDTDVEDMRRWSHDFIAGIGNVLDQQEIWDRCTRSQAEVDALVEELIPFYRDHPNDSMLSAWANSDVPDIDIHSNVKLSISGGMNEPQHMVTNMVWALSKHPEQRQHVLADPTLWTTVFEEAVRWFSPIGMYPRETTRAVTLAGAELPAGAPLGIVVASANRDQSQFGDNADAFDIFRERRPHLAFGGGAHLCLGQRAARLGIGEIAVPLLYDRFPGLTVETSRPETWDGWVFRGMTSLPVTWN